MDLREEIERKKRELADVENKLAMAERNCVHVWGNVEDASIHTPGYTDPGDPPGTMGIDWRGPVHVPSRTEKRWKRVCTKCGKTEFTSQTTEHVIHTPKFD